MKYAVVIEKGPNSYGAYVPDLPGCVAVGDSVEDDVEGARALGMSAFLVDRENRFPEVEGRLPDLYALPAALGLPRPG